MSYDTKIEQTEDQLKIYREGFVDDWVDGKLKGENGAHLYLNKRKQLLDLWVGFTSEDDKVFQRSLTMNHKEMIVMRNFLNECLESYITDEEVSKTK